MYIYIFREVDIYMYIVIKITFELIICYNDLIQFIYLI